jgi:hypothetical protein
MKTLFELCIPRDDVRSGVIKESDFAADFKEPERLLRWKEGA